MNARYLKSNGLYEHMNPGYVQGIPLKSRIRQDPDQLYKVVYTRLKLFMSVYSIAWYVHQQHCVIPFITKYILSYALTSNVRIETNQVGS